MKLVGFTVKVGAAQFHLTGTIFAGLVKVKVMLFGQVRSGTEMITCAVLPGGRIPLAGLKVIPLPAADQPRPSWPSPLVTEAVHLQP